VAEARAAWNEDHGGWSDPGEKQRVVIRAADHPFIAQAMLLTRLNDNADDGWRALRRRVRIHRLDPHLKTAARGDIRTGLKDFLEDVVRGASSRYRAHPLRSVRGWELLFTAPGKTLHTPTVATVSMAPLDLRPIPLPAQFRRRQGTHRAVRA